MSHPQFPVGMPQGREHIPLLPRGFIAIRIVQLVLSLIILALAAYGISYLPFDGNNFILAVAIMTMLSSVYHLVAKFGPPAAYNYWVVLGLDIFFVVMWLCSFALLAARVGATFSAVDSYYGYSYLSGYDLIWLSTQAAAAGLGGIEFVLFLVALIIHSIRLHHHRAAGLHSTPGTPPGPRQHNTAAAPTVVYADKAGNPVYPQQQQQQQQQPYTQQQPIPAHLQGQPPPPFYPAPGYAPVPMNHMQGQPVPVQGMPIQMQHLPPQQQQQQQYPQPYPQQQQPQHQQQQPQQQPQPIVPQPTGDSQTPSSIGKQQHAQVQTPPPQQQHNQPYQQGGVVAGELGGSQVGRD